MIELAHIRWLTHLWGYACFVSLSTHPCPCPMSKSTYQPTLQPRNLRTQHTELHAHTDTGTHRHRQTHTHIQCNPQMGKVCSFSHRASYKTIYSSALPCVNMYANSICAQLFSIFVQNTNYLEFSCKFSKIVVCEWMDAAAASAAAIAATVTMIILSINLCKWKIALDFCVNYECLCVRSALWPQSTYNIQWNKGEASGISLWFHFIMIWKRDRIRIRPRATSFAKWMWKVKRDLNLNFGIGHDTIR